MLCRDNHYQIDFEDLEEQLQSGVKAMILCSPHNPVGRVWTTKELSEIARLCLKNEVLIISDEIHADLTFPSVKHTPMAAISKEVSNQCITCMAPSKTFNLAGLQASYTIIENEHLKKKFDEQLSKQGLGSLNTMGNFAMEAAYNHGDQWLDELKALLHSHTEYVLKAFESSTDKIKVTKPEGTYLLWMDCTGMDMNSDQLKTFMIKNAKVGLNPGISYGEEGGQFMRMNIACPSETLQEGVRRILEAIKTNESVHA
ncbi:aminotransferase class I/II-fold pyridoxal phosphate-dependent enzyme [Virgibacillus halophilus]|uniref:cysteine-S-conjugate beta-lyase n=1 Tax=Tigheibacillus halophilus TaxID=361280 RepID=A0ABU5C1I8_9BACI|nr:aminotransferase class I/II-fold pyridoxal phosphate-dependent enzyme [Virgibacillus halophilus]